MEEDSLFYSAIKDATPAMSRYFEIKSQYPGCLLLFRIGDFYEMFFDDAKVASSILNIALTHRGKHGNEDIPMCGIPVATLDNYLGKLVRYGQKIAVCDQMENPEEAKKRGHKAVIKREVTRIITAGTLLEDVLLNAEKNNYLMAIVPSICKKTSAVKTISFSAIDISTGDFFVNSVVKEEFPNIINVYAPKEVLVPSRHENDEFGKYVAAVCEIHITFLPDSKFNPIVERERLERYFKVDTLDSFGITMNEELAACGAVLEYLLITQRGHLSSLPIPKRTSMGAYLILDPSTSKSLEITVSCRGEYQPSLLGSIDQTVTPLGARNLAARISTPIVDRDLLEKRLDCVEFFVENRKAANLLREIIRNCPDFERALNRVRFNKFSPRDIGDIRECLRIVEHLKSVLKDVAIPSEGEYLWENLRDFSSLLELLETALADKLPAGGRTGCLIADGYSKELDQLKYMKDHSEELIADLRNKYVDETDVGTLRIKNNGILGWYIEIPISQKSKMLGRFIHRQTLQNAVRYTSVELMSLQAKFTEALEQWNQLEQKIYGDVVRKLTSYHDDFVYAAKLLANLDVYTNFAHIAVERNYVRPVISPDPILEIEEGRHPVLELQEKEFTPNDCHLTMEERICLLTGPNMAGKSTYLRQNALMIILAQMGCYVPAKKATVGVVNRLFSRIGASDDIARGRSTFMVEMIETAAILNQANENSFVILDEVGRGTSTYDGLSIAWAVVENLYRVNKCRVLFATHYGELTSLRKSIKSIKCKTLKVHEWNGEVVFYHKIIDGVADKSYGIHVAGVAGVPKSVIKRATELLKKLESNSRGEKGELSSLSVVDFDQMELNYSAGESRLQQKIRSIDMDSISPKDALDILYELGGMV